MLVSPARVSLLFIVVVTIGMSIAAALTPAPKIHWVQLPSAIIETADMVCYTWDNPDKTKTPHMRKACVHIK